LRRDVRFTRRWRSLRQDQLTREDIRQVTQIETEKHAFQAVIEMPYQAVDCFSRTDPVVVPARTLLSQLL
jgi:hypothetical protein